MKDRLRVEGSRRAVGAATALLATVALTALAACSSTTGPDEVDLDGALVTGPVELELPYGQDVQVPGTVLHLTLTAVLEDSRCPVDVVCVWEGNAVVQVGIAAGMGPTFPLQMNTTLEPRSAVWNGVRMSLLSLTPAPRSDTPTDPADYRATVRVEPAD